MKVLAKVCRSFAPVTQFKSGAFSINTGTDNTITSTDGTGTDTGGTALDWNCTDVLATGTGADGTGTGTDSTGSCTSNGVEKCNGSSGNICAKKCSKTEKRKNNFSEVKVDRPQSLFDSYLKKISQPSWIG